METLGGFIAGAFFGAVIGLLVGPWMRDKQWRAAARHGRRMESGGRLYFVKKDPTFNGDEE